MKQLRPVPIGVDHEPERAVREKAREAIGGARAREAAPHHHGLVQAHRTGAVDPHAPDLAVVFGTGRAHEHDLGAVLGDEIPQLARSIVGAHAVDQHAPIRAVTRHRHELPLISDRGDVENTFAHKPGAVHVLTVQRGCLHKGVFGGGVGDARRRASVAWHDVQRFFERAKRAREVHHVATVLGRPDARHPLVGPTDRARDARCEIEHARLVAAMVDRKHMSGNETGMLRIAQVADPNLVTVPVIGKDVGERVRGHLRAHHDGRALGADEKEAPGRLLDRERIVQRFATAPRRTGIGAAIARVLGRTVEERDQARVAGLCPGVIAGGRVAAAACKQRTHQPSHGHPTTRRHRPPLATRSRGRASQGERLVLKRACQGASTKRSPATSSRRWSSEMSDHTW